MGIFILEPSLLRRIYYRLEDLFRSPAKLPPDSEREIAEFCNEGFSISVETALNSRCTSDYDENPIRFHWGMFDRRKKLSSDQTEKVISLAKICRFTNEKVEIQFKDNLLHFVIDHNASGVLRDWLMVESGMQQQAIGLVCAALGIGMVFVSLGNDGSPISKTDFAATRIRLDAMKPSYEDSLWSTSPPGGRKAWLTGNLADPARNGSKPLISVLDQLKIENSIGHDTKDDSISQLLWAARGRTPHYYKSRPWGMTIPTSHGEQNISSIYLISNDKLSRYSNWHWNRPTHSLEELSGIEINARKSLKELFPLYNCFIIIGKNENFARALWETGYQLLNLLLQAQVMDLAFEAILLNENQRKIFQQTGINDPVAVLMLKR